MPYWDPTMKVKRWSVKMTIHWKVSMYLCLRESRVMRYIKSFKWLSLPLYAYLSSVTDVISISTNNDIPEVDAVIAVLYLLSFGAKSIWIICVSLFFKKPTGTVSQSGPARLGLRYGWIIEPDLRAQPLADWHTHTHTHTRTDTLIHTRIHTQTHALIQKSIHTYLYTHTGTHAYALIHTRIQTHTHTHTI